MNSVPCQEIVSAHSPDSDDAFMFYGLATKKVRSSKVTFRHVLSDIETLNRKAMEGVYELSAISYHAYPYVADKYVLMASGSSIGDGYGPMIISNRPMEPEEVTANGPALVIRAGGGRVGESFAVEGERMSIGRRPDSEVFLDDVTVSRDHALLIRRGEDWYLDDCGSLNGTYVNRSRIESHHLEEGDEVQIGKYKLTFHAR